MQAALHADEMPGVIALVHLMDLLDAAKDRITGEVVIVPVANTIGLSQWIAHKPQGRQELAGLQNANRGYPDLAALAGDGLELAVDVGRNLTLIRAALAGLPACNELAAMNWPPSGWRCCGCRMMPTTCWTCTAIIWLSSTCMPRRCGLPIPACSAAASARNWR